MAKTFKRTTTINADADKLLEVLIAPDFQEAREKAQAALKVEVNELSRSAGSLVYEVHSTEYAKGVTGIDKTKTEVVITTYTWDLKARSCSWVYRSEHGNKVQVNGTLRVEAAGDGARLHDQFSVAVKVPLVGGKIEGIILKEVEKGYPAFERVLRDFAEG